ncbi:MAG TPA: pyridoxamine 5'-phosphate oxidase family protein [Candidatus Binatia bacterium]|nr:pyridoxamine 5'-phosphate oxidase family protein [Candidatus Binatia bacterium]
MLTLAVAAIVLATTVAAAGFPPDVVRALETSSYLYIATRRADGSRSSVVPVWFSWDGEALTFTTAPGSHKARRIGKGSPLLVWVGSESGPHFEARAELLRDPDLAARMGEAYSRKYWIAWLGFFRPRADRVQAGKTIIVRIRPPA